MVRQFIANLNKRRARNWNRNRQRQNNYNRPMIRYSMVKRALGKVHQFKRTFRQSYQVLDRLDNRGYAAKLSDLPNYTEFTALFDMYKIHLVKTTVIFDKNSASVSTASATNFIPNLIWVIDRDDATALGSLTEYEQYDDFKIRRLDKPVKIFWRPKVASAVYSGGAFTGYSSVGQRWIDCASPSTEHYGLKTGVMGDVEGGAGLNTIGMIHFYHTFYMTLKDVQ